MKCRRMWLVLLLMVASACERQPMEKEGVFLSIQDCTEDDNVLTVAYGVHNNTSDSIWVCSDVYVERDAQYDVVVRDDQIDIRFLIKEVPERSVMEPVSGEYTAVGPKETIGREIRLPLPVKNDVYLDFAYRERLARLLSQRPDSTKMSEDEYEAILARARGKESLGTASRLSIQMGYFDVDLTCEADAREVGANRWHVVHSSKRAGTEHALRADKVGVDIPCYFLDVRPEDNAPEAR